MFWHVLYRGFIVIASFLLVVEHSLISLMWICTYIQFLRVGEPTGIPYGDSFDETKLNSNDTDILKQYKSKTQNTKVESQNKRKELQALLNISEDEMKQLVNKRSPDKGFSLNQIVNIVVYTSLFTLLAYVVNRDCDGALFDLFVLYFPREARVLKLV